MTAEPLLAGTGALLTCAPEAQGLLRLELADAWPSLPAPRWLADGLALVSLPDGFEAFAAEVKRVAPVFLRHLAPVQVEQPVTASRGVMGALKRGLEALEELAPADAVLAVQVRQVLERGGSACAERMTALEREFAPTAAEVTQCRIETAHPERIVSALLLGDRLLMGVSDAAENLSTWPGGERRYLQVDGQVSRAEFKLLEALDVFGMVLPASGVAMDMGAAPGGWSRVLLEKGLSVVAVDPAKLDPALLRDGRVTHLRSRVEERLADAGPVDVIVNDMRLDPRESVSIMLRAAQLLPPAGPAVMTLKLPEGGVTDRALLGSVRACLRQLEGAYCVVGARRLFHNRSEVTVALTAGGKRTTARE